jgi:tricorn protease-like protein
MRFRLSSTLIAGLFVTGLLCHLADAAADTAAPQGYYRYPALHGDTIAFVAEGDVWTVGV